MSDHAWMILHDYTHDRNPQQSDAAGTIGPADITPVQRERVKRGEPFRLYDEDGLITHSGRCLCNPDDETGYAPLEEFGMPDASEIRYQDHSHHGKWISL